MPKNSLPNTRKIPKKKIFITIIRVENSGTWRLDRVFRCFREVFFRMFFHRFRVSSSRSLGFERGSGKFTHSLMKCESTLWAIQQQQFSTIIAIIKINCFSATLFTAAFFYLVLTQKNVVCSVLQENDFHFGFIQLFSRSSSIFWAFFEHDCWQWQRITSHIRDFYGMWTSNYNVIQWIETKGENADN